ncbi:MAG TPA: SIS domain-containing protein [Egibacteraceae bacterium]|nr:SIS domain-containing protein [Egibacteraceae bacterium]
MATDSSAGGIESLYPFLYADASNVDAVLTEVRRSTVEKAAEIVALREQVFDLYADQLLACAEAMAGSFAAGGKLFAFGNGGSSTDAQDVVNTFFDPGGSARPLPALSLTGDVAVLTALSNDVGFEVVYARQIAAFGRAGDIAFGLSTSGGSENVLRAFDEASRRGLITVGMAGYDGGPMAAADNIEHLFVVPSSSVHRIQEAQTTLYHVLWELTQTALQGDMSDRGAKT